MKYWLVMLAGLLIVSGCASGPLTLDMQYVSETLMVEYHLDDTGTLTVRAPQTGTPGRENLIHTAHLTGPQLAQLKQTIMNSGFFLEESMNEDTTSVGPLLRMEIELGLWKNQVETHGGLASVAKIVRAIDPFLPEALRLPYSTRAAPKPPDEMPW